MHSNKIHRSCLALAFFVSIAYSLISPATTLSLLSEGFEGDTSAWTFSGLAHVQENSTCATASPGYASGVRALEFSNACTYAPNDNGIAAFGTTLTIPGDAIRARLMFSDSLYSEGGWDYALVETSQDDGATWQEWFRRAGNYSTWQTESIDVSNLIGASFKLRFRFYSDSSIQYYGWWVDDVALEYDSLGPGESGVGIIDGATEEGDSGTKNLTMVVSVEPPNAGTISMVYDVYSGTASSPQDYIVPSERSFTIPANTSSYSIQIPIVGDQFREPNETFNVEIASQTASAIVVRGRGTATIENDDFPTCQFEDGFDSGIGNWSLTGPWQVINSSGCISTPPSGWPVIGIVNEGTCTPDLAGQTTVALESVNSFAIPANALDAFVSFQTSGPLYNTYGNLSVSADDGATWSYVYSFYASNTWRSFESDLSVYRGQSVKLRFVFNVYSETASGGIFLDDIKICTDDVPTGYSSIAVGTPLSFTETNIDQTVDIPLTFSPPTTAEVRLNVDLGLNLYGSYLFGPEPSLVSSEIIVPAGSTSAEVSILLPGDMFVEDDLYAWLNFTITQGPALFPNSNGNYSTYQSTIVFHDDDLPTCLISEDFESGDADWRLEGFWHVQESSSCVSPSALSGVSSLTLSDEFNCDLSPNSSDLLATAELVPTVQIPESSMRAQLKFSCFASVEYDYWKPLVIEVSNDGGSSWTLIGEVYSYYDGWLPYTFDLTEYAGDTLRIRFRAQSQDEYFYGAGWYIDDFSICYDPLPTGYHLVYVDHEVTETDGTSSTNVPVRITPVAPYPVTIEYQTFDPFSDTYEWYPAYAGDDYLEASGSVTIPSNTAQATFPLSIIGNNYYEPTEVLGVTLVNSPAASNIIIRSSSNDYYNPSNRVVIYDDDLLSDLVITGTGGEGSNVTVRVYASPVGEQPISFSYATTDGSAWEGLDYSPITGIATIPAGSPYVEITVPIEDDLFVEGTETFTFTATVTAGETFGTIYSEALNILDNEPVAGYLISDGFDSGAGNWTTEGLWHLQSDSTCLLPDDLGYVSAANAMVYNSEDFCVYTKSSVGYLTYNSALEIPEQADSVTLTWNDWLETETGDLATIEISTDNGVNWIQRYSSETTTGAWNYQELDLSDLAGQTFLLRFGFQSDSDNTTGIGWYIDDVSLYVSIPTYPPGYVPVSIAVTTVTEGSPFGVGGGQYHEAGRTAQVTVSLAQAATSPITLHTVIRPTIARTSGQYAATAGSDFTDPGEQIITFATGETQKTVSINLLQDREVEVPLSQIGYSNAGETFDLAITSAIGPAYVSGRRNTVTIAEDDFPSGTVFGPYNYYVAISSLTVAGSAYKYTTGYSGMSSVVAAEFIGNDFSKLYCVDFGFDSEARFVVIDTGTGEASLLGTFSTDLEVNGGGEYPIGDLAYDNTTGKLFMISAWSWGDPWAYNAYHLDTICPPFTSACRENRISSGNQGWMISAIAVHPITGVLYGLGRNGNNNIESELKLVEINKANGAISSEKGTGIFTSLWQSGLGLDFDRASGRLYASVYGSFYEIDTGTGQSTYKNIYANEFAIASKPPAVSEILANDVLAADVEPKGVAIRNVSNATGSVLEVTNSAGVGDIDGDGYDDFVVCFAAANSGDGMAKLVWGPLNQSAGEIPAADLASATYPGIEFRGPTGSAEHLGYCASSAGDVNDDGKNDFLLGYYDSSGTNSGQGGAYIVYGMAKASFPTGVLNGVVNMGSLNAFPVQSRPGKITGLDLAGGDPSVTTAPIGDFNADNYDDILISARKSNGALLQTYIIFGTAGTLGTNSRNLTALDGTNGVRITNGLWAGTWYEDVVAPAGDFNGDGYDDIIFGSPGINSSQGRAFIVYGHRDYGGADPLKAGALDPMNLGSNVLKGNNPVYTQDQSGVVTYPGIILEATAYGAQQFGASVAGVGDFNGDGKDDVVVGCPLNGGQGGAWLIKGGQILGDTQVSLNLSDTPPLAVGLFYRGIHTTGDRFIPNDDNAGWHVTGLGDFNADGFADFAIVSQASYLGFSKLGATYIIFGAADKDQPANTKVNLQDLTNLTKSLNRTVGITIRGMRMDNSTATQLGYGIQSVGDVNDDGFNDAIIGSNTVLDDGSRFSHHLIYGYAPLLTDASKLNLVASTTASFTNFIRPVPVTGTGTPLELEPRDVGAIPSKAGSVPLSRVRVGFTDGGSGGGDQTSRQDVTLYRERGPDLDGIGENFQPTKVYWKIQTDRSDFSASNLKFYYRPEDLVAQDGSTLEIGDCSIFWSPSTDDVPPTDIEDWYLMPTTLDVAHRTISMVRSHPVATAQQEFNGYYMLTKGTPEFLLGQEIPPTGISPLQVNDDGPIVEPAGAALWFRTSTTGIGKLYAVQAGTIVIKWRDKQGNLRPQYGGRVVWPSDSALYQTHIANTYPVDLSNATSSPVLSFARLTTSEATGATVDEAQRRFSASGPGRSMIVLATLDNPYNNPVTNQLYFQFINTIDWFDPAYLQDVTQPVDIGSPIVPDVALQKVPGVLYPVNVKSRYCDRPGFCQRETRTVGNGGIVPVNLDVDTGTDPATDREDDLVVAYYEPGAKLVDAALIDTVPTTADLVSASKMEWPYKPLRYEAQWPAAPAQIVMANQTNPGTGPLPPATYGDIGTSWNLYVQNEPQLPGFNPNDEHAWQVAAGPSGAILAVRDDLETPTTSKPYVLMTYVDPSTNVHRIKVWQVTRGSFNNLPVVAGEEMNRPAPLSAYEQNIVDLPASFGKSGPFYKTQDGVPYSKAGSLAAVQARTASGFVTTNNVPVPIDYRYFYQAFPASSAQFPFYYPAEKFPTPPAPGDSIPWLQPIGQEPEPVIYQSTWPLEVPTIWLGETAFGLDGPEGFPKIGGNCVVDIAYQQSMEQNHKPSVHLIDAQSRRHGHLELPGLPDGLSFAKDLTPLLAARMEYLNGELLFKGTTVPASEARVPYIALNVMTSREYDELYNLTLDNLDQVVPWQTAVDLLYADAKAPIFIQPLPSGQTAPTYQSGDLALTTCFAESTGFVTLVFNDVKPTDTCQGSPALNTAVVFVEQRVDPGIVDFVPPRGPFDFKVTMRQSGSYREKLNAQDQVPDFKFEWEWIAADDLPPSNPIPDSNTVWNPFNGVLPPSGVGAIDVSVNPTNASPTLLLSDTWWRCRLTPTAALGAWPAPDATYTDPDSGQQVAFYDWTPAQIAPGWIKRVLGNFDGIRQRVKPLVPESPEAQALNKIETLGSTAEDIYDDYILTRPNNIISMIQQAGKRWTGDVPLTEEAANQLGLIELYETIINLAASKSIESSQALDTRYDGTHPIFSSLLLAAGRLGDMYTLLGNEAYADASNPTITMPVSGGPANWGIAAPSVFCFQGQVGSLLYEELGLLRGLDVSAIGQDGLKINPNNKLRWNFSAGVNNEAEAAYALNYGIKDEVGALSNTIDEADAQANYPQGHGDAWGHYLTALQSYYRLLHNDKFKWTPRTQFITNGGSELEIKRFDERKFASIAAAKARSGAEVVNLTYRANYTDSPDKQWLGYKDTDAERAWGVDDWARRAGLGAYVDWAVANAILPPVPEGQDTAGIRFTSRANTPEIEQVSSEYGKIQRQLNNADQGLNPLGISKNTIPFNITEASLQPNGNVLGSTFFEQQRDKALTALNEAVNLFTYAQESTQQLREQADSVDVLEENVTDREFDFRNRLIDVFGRPYAGDPAYSIDYNGPDLMHYGYVTEGPLTGDSQGSQPAQTLTFSMQVNDFVADANGLPDVNANGTFKTNTRNVDFHISTLNSRFGFVVPSTWGERPAQGSIQQAQSELLLAKTRLEQGMMRYEDFINQITDQSESIQAQLDVNADKIDIQLQGQQSSVTLNQLIKDSTRRQLEFQKRARMATLIASAVSEGIPGVTGIIAGLANGIISDLLAPLRTAIQQAGNVVAEIFTQEANKQSLQQLDYQQAKEWAASETQLQLTTVDMNAQIEERLRQLRQTIRSEASQRLEVYMLEEQVRQASQRYVTALSNGLSIFEDLKRFRRRTAEDIQIYRYKDILLRVFRDDALQKYRGAFDAAAQQMYVTALAYDYDTAVSSDGPYGSYSAEKLLENLVRERSIGKIQNGSPVAGVGLAGVLNDMNTKWTTLKSDLGINNPEQGIDPRFSLRYENYRVRAEGTTPADLAEANKRWQQALRDAYVPDLYQIPEFNRFCKFATTLPSPQPGLVLRFRTKIDQNAILNFFGKDVAPFDHTFPTGRYSTKIYKTAVYLEGWNEANFGPSHECFVVPVGADVLLNPLNLSVERRFNVVNQTILPFDLVDNVWTDPNWNPTLAGPQPFTKIRRFSTLKMNRNKQYGEEEWKDIQLAGRSVTNDAWLLIIPGQFLWPTDPNEGINRFIEGRLLTGSTTQRDGNGVTDIQLWFDTYSYTGGAKRRLQVEKEKQDAAHGNTKDN